LRTEAAIVWIGRCFDGEGHFTAGVVISGLPRKQIVSGRRRVAQASEARVSADADDARVRRVEGLPDRIFTTEELAGEFAIDNSDTLGGLRVLATEAASAQHGNTHGRKEMLADNVFPCLPFVRGLPIDIEIAC
jgi:hypothetical protein